jgi:large repetitive protein
MAGVISGNGLGWFNGSMTQLGRSLGGRAGIGQSNESAYVNVANGNLVLSGRDEQVQFRNLGLDYVRTYNSQGVASAGSDAWLFGFESKLNVVRVGKGGIISHIERTGDDGSVTRYDFDSATSSYLSKVGDGAHDQITFNPAGDTLTWIEGSSQIQETFELFGDKGYLTKRRDRYGAESVFLRDGGAGAIGDRPLLQISNAAGDNITINWDAQGRVTMMRTDYMSYQGHDHAVFYEYDSLGRLEFVRTDLKPGPVGSASNADKFSTQYSYDGNSLRIASVSQSDGVQMSFTYTQVGADWKVASVTSGIGGDAQTINYQYSSNRTRLIDAQNRAWDYVYDANNQLSAVWDPAVNGARVVRKFTYDTSGNLLSEAIAEGQNSSDGTPDDSSLINKELMSYTYDVQGNLIWQRDLLGNSVKREYNVRNQLVKLTQFSDLDPDGSGDLLPTQGLSTSFVYDKHDWLRFEVSATGGVKEYVYDPSPTKGSSPTQVGMFVSNAAGQVRRTIETLQNNYSGTHDLISLEAWAVNQTGAQEVRDFSYDARGLLIYEERYAETNRATIDDNGSVISPSGIEFASPVRAYLGDVGAEFIGYAYDRQGLMVQRIVYRGANRDQVETQSFAYDGMGRLLGSTQSATSLATGNRATTVVYDDVDNKIITTFASGMVRTEARNTRGALITLTEVGLVDSSISQARTVKNFYNALGQLVATRDAQNALNYFFYDDSGRLSAEVDSTGTLTRHSYSAANRLSSLKTFATRLATTTVSGWYTAVSDTVNVPYTVANPADSVDDRVVTTTYNTAGQLEDMTDAEGTKTTYTYDGAGRVVQTKLVSSLSTADTRRTRMFYDDSGRLIASLDAANYLTRNHYDAAGRLIKTVSTAGITTAMAGVTVDTARLDQLLVAQDANKDQITRYFYNGRSELTGTLDAEGYLTVRLISEVELDDAGQSVRTIRTVRYAQKIDAPSGAESLAELVSQVEAGFKQTTVSRQNAAGETYQINRAGLLTTYQYDTSGRLVETKVNDIDDADQVVEMKSRVRYNSFGEIVQTLRPEGVSQIEQGLLTEAQAWSQWGIQHRYNLLGQRIESIDGEGNATWYFYDKEGRLQYTALGVKAVGSQSAKIEVQQAIYNAFGEVERSIAFTGKLDISSYTYAAAQTRLATLPAVDAQDGDVKFTYNKRGQLLTSTEVGLSDIAQTNTYTGFGQLKKTALAAAINGVLGQQTTDFEYDKRGMQTAVIQDQAGLNLRSEAQYDAFGRMTRNRDARGQWIELGYDRLGRKITISQLVQAQGGSNLWNSNRLESSAWTFDAYDRVLTSTDALGRETTYSYEDDKNGDAVDGRLTTMTTPEGVTVITRRNLRGMTLSIEKGVQKSTFRYNLDGNLISTKQADNSESKQAYDKLGRLFESEDATLIKTRYEYDHAGRILRRIERAQAPVADHLITKYEFDARGRTTKVTDASDRVTTTSFNQATRTTTITLGDVVGEQTISKIQYDPSGREVLMTTGSGTDLTVTKYKYDAAGRRVEEVVDPDGMKITTKYEYDKNGNVIARHNSKYLGSASNLVNSPDGVTRYVYDSANRLIYMLDQSNALTQYWYDANGSQVATTRYATKAAASLASTSALTLSQVQAALTVNDALDMSAYQLYDRDGRLSLSFGADGVWTQYRYDSIGQLKETIVSNTSWSLNTNERLALRKGSTTIEVSKSTLDTLSHFASRFAAETNSSLARRSYQTYDQQGRVQYSVLDTGNGALVQLTQYDAAGRVIASTQYAKSITYVSDQSNDDIQAALTALGTDTDANRRRTLYTYDSAGRLHYTLQETELKFLGLNGTKQHYVVTEVLYDGAGRVSKNTSFGNDVWFSGDITDASVTQSLSGATRFSVSQLYDAAGRKIQTLDALNHAEVFAYDARGLLVSYTDRMLAQWTYTYDSAGRKTLEKSPEVKLTLAEIGDNSSLGINFQTSERTRSVLTKFEYDALGNLIRKTDDAYIAAISGTFNPTFRTRAAEYQYDNRGNQVRTIFPAAGRISNDLTIKELTFVEPTGADQKPELNVSYNALGLAVVQKDTRGYFAYKAYDNAGRMRFEIDQERNVTEYIYNTFGEIEKIIRHANQATLPAGFVAGSELTLAAIEGMRASFSDTTKNRTIETLYDKRGLKSAVLMDSVNFYANGQTTAATGRPETTFVYDSYGRLIKESIKINATDWADTIHFYDEAGRKVATVDAGLYVTRFEYNARNLMTRSTEYASALTAPPSNNNFVVPAGNSVIGNDRVTQWSYDELGRKKSETLIDVAGTDDLITSFSYDKESRLTKIEVKDLKASNTSSFDYAISERSYDALGRLTLEKGASHGVFASSVDFATATTNFGNAVQVQVSKTTGFYYDAFGNMTIAQIYANDASNNNYGVSTNIYVYDRQGRLLVEQSGNAAPGANSDRRITWREYDNADNVVKTTQLLKISGVTNNAISFATDTQNRIVQYFSFDATNRQTQVDIVRENWDLRRPIPDPDPNAPNVWRWGGYYRDHRASVTYNAFGEVTNKKVHSDTVGLPITDERNYIYDKLGRIVSSNDNETGADRSFGYNLASQKTFESRNNPSNPSALVYYKETLDNLGRSTSSVSPKNSSASAATEPTITRQFDRWNNVIGFTDAKGNRTDFEFNRQNQVTKEMRASVQIVSDAGVATTARTVSTNRYDVLGRLIEATDANQNTKKNEYDNAGNLIKVRDGNNQDTYYKYDGLGRLIYTQNARGYITYNRVDELGRVVESGDYLPNDAQSARVKAALQNYALNQNGDRLQVSTRVSSTLSNLQKYDFNSRGQIVTSVSAAGVKTDTFWDELGRKIREVTGAGTTQTWTYDQQGRMTAHKDLGDRVYAYTNSASGSQTGVSITSAGATMPNATRSITYYDNGQIKQVTEGQNSTSFVYDLNGQIIEEINRTFDANNTLVWVKTTTTYDAQGRITQIVRSDLSQPASTVIETVALTMNYSYDAAGNRRKIEALSTYRPSTSTTTNSQEYWYTYDAMNRVKVTNGKLQNGQILAAEYRVGYETSFAYEYDEVGNVILVTLQNASGPTTKIQKDYTLRNQLWRTYAAMTNITSTYVDQERQYDDAGRLIATFEFYPEGTTRLIFNNGNDTGPSVNVGGWVSALTRYEYNADGTLLKRSEYGRKHGVNTSAPPGMNQLQTSLWAQEAQANLGTITAAMQMSRDPNVAATALNQLSETIYTLDSGSGPLTLGLVKKYTEQAFFAKESESRGERLNMTTNAWVHYSELFRFGDTRIAQNVLFTYTITHQAWDGYVEAGNSGVASGGAQNTTYAPGSTSSTYDAFGRRTIIEENTRAPNGTDPIYGSKRVFTNTADGKILTRSDFFRRGSAAFSQTPAAGELISNPVSHLLTNTQWDNLNGDDRNAIIADSRNQRFVYTGGNQVASLSKAGNLQTAAFATGFSSSENGSTSVQVMQGETLRSLARRIYGAEELWYVIAGANSLSNPDQLLISGQTLVAPQVTTNVNNANTYRPYRPSELSGPTQPNVPYIPPPPKAGCDPTIIITIIVAAVATAFTAGATAGLFGTVTASAGSTVSASVLAGTATITTASGTVLAGAAYAGAIATSAFAGGVVGSVAGQLTSRALGLTDSFSLRQAVAGGFTSVIGAGIGGFLNSDSLPNIIGARSWATAATSAALNTVGGYVANKLAGVDNTHFSWRNVAANAVTAGISAPLSRGAIGALGIEGKEFASNLVANTIGGVIGMHTRRAFGVGGVVDYGRLTADAFGNAVANELNRALDRRSVSLEVQMPRIRPPQVERIRGDAAQILNQRSRDRAEEFMNANIQRTLAGLDTSETAATSVASAGGAGPSARRSGLGGVQRMTPGKETVKVSNEPYYTKYLPAGRLSSISYTGSWDNKAADGIATLDEVHVTRNGWYFSKNWDVQYGMNIATPEDRAKVAEQLGAASDFELSPLQRIERERISAIADGKAYFNGFRGSFVGDSFANGMSYANIAGNSILAMLKTGYAGATDHQARIEITLGAVNAVGAAGHAIANPGETYNSAVNATSRFFELSGAQQAEIIGSGGIEFLATAGLSQLKAVQALGAAAKAPLLRAGRMVGALDDVADSRLSFRGIEAAERQAALGASNLREIGSRGVRNAEVLNASQVEQLYQHVDQLGLNRDDFLISSHISAYSENWDKVLLGPNAFPGSGRTTRGVFETMTPRAVVAHEAGHMITTRSGTAFEAGSLFDEVGASLTGRKLPGLNSTERYQLLRDAAERARIENRSLREVISEMENR